MGKRQGLRIRMYLFISIVGKYHGVGTLVKKCGDEYSGSWKEGLKHGKGKLVTAGALCGNEFKRKNRCFGTPKREEEHGKQKCNNVKGSIHIYEGDWLDDKKCGVGKIVYHSGVVFEGELEDDNPVKVIIIHYATSSYHVCIFFLFAAVIIS